MHHITLDAKAAQFFQSYQGVSNREKLNKMNSALVVIHGGTQAHELPIIKEAKITVKISSRNVEGGLRALSILFQ